MTWDCPILRPAGGPRRFGLDHRPVPGPLHRIAQATGAIGRIANRRFVAAPRLVQAKGYTVLVIDAHELRAGLKLRG
jgi:hypothetical protein